MPLQVFRAAAALVFAADAAFVYSAVGTIVGEPFPSVPNYVSEYLAVGAQLTCILALPTVLLVVAVTYFSKMSTEQTWNEKVFILRRVFVLSTVLPWSFLFALRSLTQYGVDVVAGKPAWISGTAFGVLASPITLVVLFVVIWRLTSKMEARLHDGGVESGTV